jgi:hypothetical protein
MTVGEQIDAIVGDDLVLHGWDLALASGWDEGDGSDDVGSRRAAPRLLLAAIRSEPKPIG